MSDVAAAAGNTAAPFSGIHAWKDPKGGFSFHDLIDIVNPLQHVPIISSIYRWMTGDRPGEAAQIAGDALYGGMIGVSVGLVGAALEDSQGHDIGERALAYMFGPSDAKTTAVAAAQPAAAQPPQAQAAAALPPAKPDHPPIPLYGYGGMATPVPPQPAAASPPGAPMPQNTAARDFLARNAAMARQVSAGTRYAPGTSAPVPLVVPPGSLQPPRPMVAAPVPVSPQAQPTAPIDVPQKMMDALDKYMRLEQDRNKARPAAPDTVTAPSVDLSM